MPKDSDVVETKLKEAIGKIDTATKFEDVISQYPFNLNDHLNIPCQQERETIKYSKYKGLSQDEVLEQVVKDFNQFDGNSKRSIMTTGLQWLAFIINLFFKPFNRIEPGHFQLVSRNNIPELVPASSELQRINITLNPFNTTIDHGTFKQVQPIIGAYGHYVLNVPLGQYAKVSYGNDNQLYGEGWHVIHNQNFSVPENYLVSQTAPYICHKDIHVFNVQPGQYARIRIGYEYYLLPPGNHKIRHANLTFEEESGFVSQNDLHISNGNKHIFNIPVGKFCKIKIGQEFHLLDAGTHFIESANLRFDPTIDFVDQTKLHINHGNIHILNIPKGMMALVLENNEPRILSCGQHVINNANFKFNENTQLYPQNQSYIKHNNLHYITVTPGHIALVSVDNETKILPGRTEPYLFQSNNFEIYHNEQQYTFDQNTKHISFNGKHYLLPDQGEVAVLYDGGQLVIRPEISPSNEADEGKADIILEESHDEEHHLDENHETKAFIIDSGTARFAEFLDTRTQTLEFPSPNVIAERVRDGEDKHEARFDKFKTADNVNVAVRFVVTYKITDPKKALQELKSRAEIERHIETLVNADMGNAIGNTTSGHLMTSEQSKAKLPEELVSGEQAEKDAEFGKQVFWQDKVKNELHKDLLEVGIELGRLNIEETFILDESVRKKMEEQSITATSAQAEMAILRTQNELAKRKAKQQREMQQYEQETQSEIARIQAEQGMRQAELQTKVAVAQTKRETEVARSVIPHPKKMN